jgi:hypothetical protein
VGVVVNFEARGSGGPSNMILETNQGNATLEHTMKTIIAGQMFRVAHQLKGFILLYLIIIIKLNSQVSVTQSGKSERAHSYY